MPEIPQTQPPLQATTIEELRRESEMRFQEMQQQIYLLRQFLEPAVINNKNTPNQTFLPLE